MPASSPAGFEAAARRRLCQDDLLPFVLEQPLLERAYAGDRDRCRLQAPFRLVKQIVLGVDRRHRTLLKSHAVVDVTPAHILIGRLDACQVLIAASRDAKVYCHDRRTVKSAAGAPQSR